ncbi:hypothetical protein NPIL_112601 [Nephila pilipes]|uniref:Uncharacterized protein n=1 Tax=Nephila pilipes TaxID=299642 RepID=A0A8X6MWZ8_NEPPI|nr:hypothetical protein NPIL_112601 [Nephila pilipes]
MKFCALCGVNHRMNDVRNDWDRHGTPALENSSDPKMSILFSNQEILRRIIEVANYFLTENAPNAFHKLETLSMGIEELLEQNSNRKFAVEDEN